MHRCLLSAALPARPRCVSSLSFPHRQRTPTAQAWLRYNTSTTVESRRDEASPAHAIYDASLPVGQQSGLNQGEPPAWTPSDQPSAKDSIDDAMDFILEGYETQPNEAVGKTRRERARQAEAVTAIATKQQRMSSEARLRSLHRQISNAALKEGKSPLTILQERNKRSSRTSLRRVWTTLLRHARFEKQRRVARARAFPAVAPSWTKPKFVSIKLGSQSANHYSQDWNVNFARAQNLYDPLVQQSTLTRVTQPPLLWPRTLDWVEFAYERLAAGKNPLATFKKAGERNVWSQVALWFLHYDKDALPDFLLATDAEPRPPVDRVLDCLQLLSTHYSRQPGPEADAQMEKLADVFIALAARPVGDRVQFSGAFLVRLLQACKPEQQQPLFTAMKTGQFQIRFHSWLQVASFFVKNDHFDLGLDAVLEAHRARVALKSYAFRSVCASLLRGSMRQPGGLRVCLRIVDNLVQIGLPLNTPLYNVIILNAVEAGDLRTAREVYRSMVDNGLKPDSFTFTILLKGCKQDISDAETLHTTIREAIDAADVNKDIVLATDILHCLTLYHTRHGHNEAWSTICQAYAQMFNVHPLERLGLPMPQSVRETHAAKPVMLPNKYAIDIMVRAYLFVASQSHSIGSSKIYDLYARFSREVSKGSPPFDNVIEPHTYNAFMTAFIKNKSTLVRAAEVIKDLQRPDSRCRPNEFTWNIFLLGFTRHGQLKLAEQVLNYMKSKGIAWTNITWNHLISGYAGAQDSDKVIDTIRRAEDSGFQWDAWTYGSMRRFRESGKLQEILRQRGYAGELDFSNEIKQGLGARIEEQYRVTELGEEVCEQSEPEDQYQVEEKEESPLDGAKVGVGSTDKDGSVYRS